MDGSKPLPRPRSLNARTGARVAPALLRALLVLDGAVFLISSTFNLGFRIPLGPVTLGFPSPIWQAAIGEAAIGVGLLVAAWTGRISHAWVGAMFATLGIAFGLLSPRVVGPAHDIHVLLVPITGLILAVLAAIWVRAGPSNAADSAAPPGGGASHRRPASAGSTAGPSLDISTLVAGLMLVAGTSYAIASLVHFGLVVSLGPITLRDPFAGAAAPEGVIAIALLFGSVAVLRRLEAAWSTAMLTAAFSTLLTVYGLSITISAGRPGDVEYHVGVLAVDVVILVLLLMPATRHALRPGDRTHSPSA